MRRWLVTLALAVVALPNVADAQGFRVELTNRRVTSTTKNLPGRQCPARVTKLPSSVELDVGAINITTPTHIVRHSLGQPDGLSWVVGVGTKHLVVGFATRKGGFADTVVAFDHTTGRIAWRRTMDSTFGAELVDDLLAVERAGNLDIVDASTGKTVGTTPLRGRSIQSVCRSLAGDLHLKTDQDLVAIDRNGAVKWTAPASSTGNPTVTPTTVIDAWVDKKKHRFGIVSYDARTGKQLDKIDLGETGGWYDVEHVWLAPDGTNDVLVSAMFAVE